MVTAGQSLPLKACVEWKSFWEDLAGSVFAKGITDARDQDRNEPIGSEEVEQEDRNRISWRYFAKQSSHKTLETMMRVWLLEVASSRSGLPSISQTERTCSSCLGDHSIVCGIHSSVIWLPSGVPEAGASSASHGSFCEWVPGPCAPVWPGQ